MYMINKILVFAVVLLFSCKNQEKSIKLTDNATLTTLEKSNSHIKPVNGDQCLVKYLIEHNDSTYEYSDDLNPDGVIYEYNENDVKNNVLNVFSLAFSSMEVGDSAQVKLKVPDNYIQQAKQKGMPMRDYILTNIRFLKIFSKEDGNKFNIENSNRLMDNYRKMMHQDTIVDKLLSNYIVDTNLNSDMKVLSDGVKYKILETGNSKKPKLGDNLKYFLTVFDKNGKKISSTFVRADYEKQKLRIGSIFPSLLEVVPNIGVGGKAIIFSPAKFAYGDNNLRDPSLNTDVYMYFELVDFRKY